MNTHEKSCVGWAPAWSVMSVVTTAVGRVRGWAIAADDLIDTAHGHPTGDPDPLGIEPGAIERLVERARQEVDAGHLPSCQVALARHGRIVATRTFGAPPSSRYVVYSTTKAITAGAVWRLLDAGAVTRDTRVAEVIDGFDANGKHGVTVEHLLTHTAGFPHAVITHDEWNDPVARHERFAAWEPEWEPGSRFTYHGTSAHWVLAAVAESATGRDFREYVATEVLDPLGLADLRLGVPETRQGDVLDVVTVGDAPDPARFADIGATTGLDVSAIGVSDEGLLEHNDPAVRALGQPAGGAIGRAADLALYYQALLANPGGLWRAGTLAAGTSEVLCTHADPMTGVASNRSLGLLIAGDDGNAFMRGFGTATSARAFGHMGAGGQVAWADPATGLSFAYLTNGLDRDPIRMGIRSNDLSTLAASVAVLG